MKDMTQEASWYRTMVANLPATLNQQDKNNILYVAIARGIAASLQQPTSPVASLDRQFATVHDGVVCDIISGLCEVMIIDHFLVRDLVFKIYEYRYKLMYDNNFFAKNLGRIAAADPESFTDAVRKSLTVELSKDDYDSYISSFNSMVWNTSQLILEELEKKHGAIDSGTEAVNG